MKLIRVEDGGGTLAIGGFTLARTGLRISGEPTFDEWAECGRVLRQIEGAVQFWIGDWLNYGAQQKGWREKYDAAVEATGIAHQTLKNYSYVAEHVESSRRRDDLPYSIYCEVAPLAAERQTEILERAAAEDLTVSKVRDLLRAEAHLEKVAAITAGRLPAGEFDVVVADPPWQYSNSGFDQSAAAQYPTLDVEAIAALPTTDPTFPRFADASVLFLWATSPLVPAALTVMTAWGFEYKAGLVWVKDKAPNLGWWVHTRHELLFVGVRGATSTPIEKVDSVIAAPVTVHSRKPAEAYDAIDRMFPGLRRVELFARTPREGWAAWGNEI